LLTDENRTLDYTHSEKQIGKSIAHNLYTFPHHIFLQIIRIIHNCYNSTTFIDKLSCIFYNFDNVDQESHIQKESIPVSIGQTEFRQALGHFASGVTVITTQVQGQLHGTTVSSFCSLSLQPPLILVGIDLGATIHDLITESKVFAVNILAEHAEGLSRHFARRVPDKFSNVPYRLGQLGVPLLDDALASLECRLVARYPGGDHAIFIGEVAATNLQAHSQPLLYFRSKYGRLQSADLLASTASTILS